jgi:hypothetical protein
MPNTLNSNTIGQFICEMMVQGRKVETKIAHDENLIPEDTQDEAIEIIESIKPNLKEKKICKKVAPHITMVKNEYVAGKGN